MDLSAQFKSYLEGQKKPASQVTIKNYVADINQFVRWYESYYSQAFHPSLLTPDVLDAFKRSQASSTAAASLERRLSTLRKFVTFLQFRGYLTQDPFTPLVKVVSDPFGLKEFRNHLFTTNASSLTIKNYLNDIKQFSEWIAKTSPIQPDTALSSLISAETLKEYRARLIANSGLSPVSINRKLSSLRRYTTWAYEKGLLSMQHAVENINPNIVQDAASVAANQSHNEEEIANGNQHATDLHKEIAIVIPEHVTPHQEQTRQTKRTYSKFPPLRLAQKLGVLATLGFDATVVALSAVLVEKVHYLTWLASGKQVFKASAKKGLDLTDKLKAVTEASATVTASTFSDMLQGNIKKEFYAPTKVSVAHLPAHKKAWHHMRHTRPSWYQKYHSYPVVHYFHFAALVIMMSALGFGMYRSFVESPQQNKTLAAAPTAPPRVMSFQGRLTDNTDTPITSAKDLRFTIYNDSSSSGSALLWQETQVVTPDQDGVFSVLLGSSTSIPSSVFTDNSTLYLGVTVQSDPELTPRQQIATVAFAANSETLQGLFPITAGGAGTTNVVLALDSSGDLTIGGSASPTFEATGGSFTLSGNVLNLQTSSGSNANVNITPDGQGLVNISKPIVNLSDNNRVATAKGAVEINDLFAILATSSGQSAVTIDQNGTGPILSASVSGSQRFTISNDGSGTFAGDVAVNGGDLTSSTSTLGVNINGGSAGMLILSDTDTIAIGGHAGAAYNAISNSGGAPTNPNVTADNDLYVQGDLDIGGTIYVNGSQLSSGALVNYWQKNNGAISQASLTDDLLLGATSTASAKFGFINVGSGTPTATISSNFSIQVPTGASPAVTVNTLKGGSLNFQTATAGQGDAGLSSRLFITNAGNVGIGSTAPTAKLDVAGGIMTSTTGICFSSCGVQLSRSSNDLLINLTNAASIRFATSNTERARFDANGNLGIGSTLPGYKLDVNGSTNTTSLYLNGSQVTSTATELNYLDGTTVTAGGVIYGNGTYLANTGVGTSGQVLISNGSSAPSWVNPSVLSSSHWQRALGAISPTNITDDVLIGGTATASAKIRLGGITNADSFFNTGGNVGIGTTAPAQKLDVAGNLTTSGNIGIATTTVTSRINLPAGTTAAEGINFGGDTSLYRSAADYLRTDDSFRVGTGIILTPSNSYVYAAALANGTSASNALVSTATTGTTISRNVADSNAALIVQQSNASSTGDILQLKNNADTVATLTQTGNLGLGSTTPGYKLDVNGSTNTTSLYLNGSQVTSTATELNYLDGTTVTAGGVIYGNGTYLDNTGAGTSGYILKSNGSSAPAWVDPASIGLVNYWQRNSGTVAPLNITDDLLLGGTATSSALIRLGGTTNANSFFNTGGNLGIGTTNPASLLQVGSFASSATVSASIVANTAINTELKFREQDDTFGASLLYEAADNQFQIRTFNGDSQGSSALTLARSSGNIAIGTTTTSTFKLRVAGSVGPDADDTYDLGSSARRWRDLYLGPASLHIGTDLNEAVISYNTTSNFMGINPSGDGSPEVTIDDNGNIGIGTTTASSYPLYVNGSGYIDGNFTITGNLVAGSTGTSGFIQRNAGALSPANITDDFLLGGTATSSALIKLGGTSNATTYFNTGGNVGIGTTTPDGKLIVSGSTNQKALVQIAGDGTQDLFTASASGSTLFLINKSGNVGIGTINPGAKLDVTGDIQTSSQFLGYASDTVTSPSYAWNGDINTGLYRPGADTVAITTGGTERLRVDANGNIGIGSTSPGAKLDIGTGALKTIQSSITEVYVEGTGVRLKNVYTGGGWARGILTYEDSTGSDYFQLGGYGSGQTFTYAYLGPAYNTAWQTWKSDGNIGIGSTSPGYKLDVNGSINTTSLYLNGSQVTSTATELNYLDGTTVTAGGVIYGNGTNLANTGVGTSGQVLISNGAGAPTWVDSTSLSSSYWQRNSGTLSPTNITDDLLLGATATSGAKFGFINIASGTPTATISSNLSLQVPTGSNPTAILNILNGGSFTVRASAGGDAGLATRLYVGNNGNVGIGTTIPTANFHIGGVSTGANIKVGSYSTLGSEWSTAATILGNNVTASTSASNMLITNTHASYGARAIRLADEEGITFHTSDGSVTSGDVYSSERMRIDENGNVGIGSTAPSFKLDVSGNGRFGTATSLTTYRATNGLILGSTSLTDTVGLSFEVQDGTQNTRAGITIDATNKLFSFNNTYASAGALSYDFATAGTSFLRINTSGNIGIGSTTPGTKLDVVGGGRFTLAATQKLQIDASTTDSTLTTGVIDVDVDTSADTAEVMNFTFTNVNDTAADTITGFYVKNNYTDPLDTVYVSNFEFSAATSPVAAAYLMQLTNVNTTNNVHPTAFLNINETENSGTAADGIFFNVGTGTTMTDAIDASDAQIDNALNLGQNNLLFSTLRMNEGTSGRIDFEDTSSNKFLTILDAGTTGNIGIGSTAPAYSLDVNGSTNTTSLYLNGSQVTSTATELNYLDGTTVTAGGVIYGDGTKLANTGAGTSGYILSSNGASAPSWTDPASLGLTNYWQRNLGALSPANITDDLLLGGTATASATVRLGAITNADSFFNTGGNVAIGTTTSGSKLSVNGGVSIGSTYVGTAAPTDGLLVSGNVGIGTTSFVGNAPSKAVALPADSIISGGVPTTNLSAIQFTANASTTAGYGVYTNFNAYWDGTNFRQPRGTLPSYLTTTNNHKGWSWMYAAAGSSDNGTVTPTEIAALNSAGDLQIDGDLAITGGNVTTATTFDSTLTTTGTLTANGALDSNGDLSIADTNIAFDGASTTFTTTGAFTLNTGGNMIFGDGGDTLQISTSDWDVSSLGVFTGVSGITTDGGYTQTGTSANTLSGATTISATGTALTLSGAATTAINISNTGVTTDISLQNGETIDNNTNGTIAITATNTTTSGNLSVGARLTATDPSNQVVLGTGDGYSQQWAIGQNSRNQMIFKDKDSNTTFTGTAGTSSISNLSKTVDGDEGTYASAVIASTSDTVVAEISNTVNNLNGSVYSQAAWWPTIAFRYATLYAQSITVEARYDGDGGSYQTIWSTTTNTNAFWQGSVTVPTGITSPYKITALRITMTNWNTTGTVYIPTIGLHHRSEQIFPQYANRLGTTFYGTVNFSGVASDITTDTGEHLALSPGGNVGIGTTLPTTFKLQVTGNVGPSTDSTYNLGSNAVRWANGYFDTLYGDGSNLTGVVASSMPFSGITSGTNTTAAMVVGAGASLDYTSTGTINASSLAGSAESAFFKLADNETVTGTPAFNGGTTGVSAPFTVDSTFVVTNLNADLFDGINSDAFLRSDTSDNFTSGTLTTDSGTTLDVNGDIAIADTNIAFDGLTTTFTTTGAFTLTPGGSVILGDGGDTMQIDTSNWDISSAGVASGLTGLTSSGTITFSGLTASRAVFTTTGGQLTSSGASSDLASSLTDETGSGVAVFGTSPAITTSLTTGSTSFDLINTTATTVNFAGAATTLTIGATTGTATIRNATTALSGDLTIAGTTGITGSGAGAGLNFSGTGTHTIQGSAGTLQINAFTLGGAVTGNSQNITGLGNLSLADTKTFALGGVSSAAYQAIANSGGTPSNPNVTADNDLYVQGDLDIGGTLYVGGSALSNYWTRTAGSLSPANLNDTISATTSASTALTITQTGAFDVVRFEDQASDTTPFIIKQDGNVGIGTTTPTNTLAVNGTISGSQFYDYDNAAYFLDPAATGTSLAVAGNVGIGTTSPLGLLNISGKVTGKALVALDEKGDQDIFTASASGTTKFVISNAGNIGIGTTAPSGLLHLYGNQSSLSVLRIQNTATGASTGTYEDFYNNDATARFGVGVNSTGHTDASAGFVWMYSAQDLKLGTNNTERLRILSGGNIGIGTSTPIGLLNISGKATGKALFNINETGNQDVFTASVSGSTKFVIANTGNVGIGSTAPINTLDVTGSIGFSSDVYNTDSGVFSWIQQNGGDWRVNMDAATGTGTQAFRIFSTGTAVFGTSTTAPTDTVDINGNLQVDLAGGTATFGICHATNGAVANQQVRDCSATPTDIAEFYASTNDVEPGDLLTLVETGNPAVPFRAVKTTNAYDQKVIGVVSTTPTGPNGKPLGEKTIEDSENPTALGLSGRVPVKVSLENGPISQGDWLTSSSIPGVAMKATKASFVIGRAIESYDGTVQVSSGTRNQEEKRREANIPFNKEPRDPQAGVGKILMVTHATYFSPEVQIAQSGNLNVTGFDEGSFTAWAGQYKFENKGGFADAVIARLTAGLTKTQQLIVNGTSTFAGTIQAQAINASSVAVSSLSIAGQSLHDYIIAVVQQAGFTNNKDINSPVATIDQLNTNVISPLGSNDVTIKGDVKIEKTASSSGNLSVAGYASVSGTLSAQDVTIAGTLRADRIIANQIEGLDARIASIAAGQLTASTAAVTNIYNTYTIATGSAVAASTSGTASNSALLATGDAYSLITSSLYSDVADISSLSASLAYLPTMSTDLATINQGLMVFGSTSLSDTAIAGQLSVNGSLILADNSINVLGSTFEIQPLRQGNLSFMGGLIAIDTDGNLSVSGNATFAKDVAIGGTLTAHIVSPVPQEDLVIQLPGGAYDQGSLAVDRPGITVKNGSGSAVLKITDVGDVIASGAGKFAELAAGSLKVVRGAQADTSLLETVASASAGTATIKAGKYERTIISPYVTEKSLIYITPVSNTGGSTPYVARQVAEDQLTETQGSFTIRIPQLQTTDVKVNWWIIN